MKHIYRLLTGIVFVGILFFPSASIYFYFGIDPLLCILYGILFFLIPIICYCIGVLVRISLLQNDDGG